MTHIVAATVQLGPAYTGLAIGYRTVRLDKTTVVTAFTTTGVAEEPAGTGRFQVDDGVVAHDEGGYIVWGESGNDILWGSLPPAPLTAQNVWEYGTRTLTSFGTLIADIWSYVTRTLTGDTSIDQQDVIDALTTYDAATGADITALGATASITIVSAVSGSTVTVYRNDTWHFTIIIAGITLTDYEAVAFVVKQSESKTDNESILYVRDDEGLVRIGGAAPDDASAGSLSVDSATAFTVHVDISETDVTPNPYVWWLKVFETGTTPDEGYTRAAGEFIVRDYGLRATE